jgi:hypothetical protein
VLANVSSVFGFHELPAVLLSPNEAAETVYKPVLSAPPMSLNDDRQKQRFQLKVASEKKRSRKETKQKQYSYSVHLNSIHKKVFWGAGAALQYASNCHCHSRWHGQSPVCRPGAVEILGSSLQQVFCKNSLRIAFDQNDRLTHDQKEHLIGAMQTKTYAQGQKIVAAGDDISKVLRVVLKGELLIEEVRLPMHSTLGELPLQAQVAVVAAVETDVAELKEKGWRVY